MLKRCWSEASWARAALILGSLVLVLVLEVDWGVSLVSIADGVLVDTATLMREIVLVVVVGVSVGEAAAACAVAMLSECGSAAQ